MIQGITVTLIEEIEKGKDEFNRSIYGEKEVQVENVLVGQPTTDDVTTQLNLTGKRAQYVLAIPKGDKHNWENKKVKFFNKTWRVFTAEVQGIESNVPLRWNKKVMVESYE